MSGHTPAPWKAEEDGIVVDENDDVIAEVYGDTDHEINANARLIASSPTLFDFVAKKAAEGDADAARIISLI